MTPFTFGNSLKFGPNSCHRTKGRQIPSSTERESTRSPTRTTLSHWEGPSNWAPHARELSPLWVIKRGLATTAAVFPPRSDRGRASTVHYKIFKITKKYSEFIFPIHPLRIRLDLIFTICTRFALKSRCLGPVLWTIMRFFQVFHPIFWTWFFVSRPQISPNEVLLENSWHLLLERLALKFNDSILKNHSHGKIATKSYFHQKSLFLCFEEFYWHG